MREAGPHPPPRLLNPGGIALFAALYALIGGSLTLIGWTTGTYRLADWLGIGISMKANAAVASIAAALAIPLCTREAPLSRWPALAVRGLGLLVAVIGGLTFLQHVTGADFGIDTLLFDEPRGMRGTAAPGRMGPPASVSFGLIGSALILATLGGRARRTSVVLAGVVVFITGVTLTGYLFGADYLYDLPRVTGISVQMASMLLALAIGISATIPEYGVVVALLRDDAGGLLARRLLLPVLIIPILFGWLENTGERMGSFDPSFGTAAFALLMVFTMAALVLNTAHRASQSDAELREADRRKDRFLATLAHELRNPLAPIRNSLEILRIAGDDPARRDMLVPMMDRQLHHIVRLVDDLLDVSRISRDKLELRVERVELVAVLREALDGCRPTITAAQQELSHALPSEPMYVDGDPVRLAQIFGNLLNNASKFTESGGRIRVTAERRGSEVVVSVMDTGIGIAPEVLPKVFEMFTQADRAIERAKGGLGIGLPLARRLTEMHGGSLTASSEGEGKGSAFVVRLPLAIGTARAERRVTEHPVPAVPGAALVPGDAARQEGGMAVRDPR